jgi:hypothetical protein
VTVPELRRLHVAEHRGGRHPDVDTRLNAITGATGALPAIAAYLADVDGRLAAAEGALTGLTLGQLEQVTSTTRGTPTEGLLKWDTTIDLPIVGTGTVWKSIATTAITGSGTVGGSAGPTSFTAVVQPDSSINLAWTLPTPPGVETITAVTVREKFVSPGGVSGMPLAGSGDHEHPQRPPRRPRSASTT